MQDSDGALGFVDILLVMIGLDPRAHLESAGWKKELMVLLT